MLVHATLSRCPAGVDCTNSLAEIELMAHDVVMRRWKITLENSG